MNLKIILIIVAFTNPNEKEALAFYTSQIRAQYELVGATRIKYPITNLVLGEDKPDFIMVVEFPNQGALQKLFTSEDYQKLVPYRQKAFTKLNVYMSQKE